VSLAWAPLLGTFSEMMLAYFLFMVVAFSGGGLVNGASWGKLHTRLLNLAIYTLPGACMASAGIVIGLHVDGAGSSAYGRYALPLAAAVVYFAYVIVLTRPRR